MTSDAVVKAINSNTTYGIGAATATWVGSSYPFPYQPLIGAQPKSDAPYIVTTLAHLLADGKITEDTFLRLMEKVIQRG